MVVVKIHEDYCKSCGLCVAFCPRHALEIGRHLNIHGFNPVVFDEAKECTGCGSCTAMCPDAAIVLVVKSEAIEK